MALPVVTVLFLVVVFMWVQQSTPQCLVSNKSAMKISEKGRQDLLQSQLQFSADLLQTVASMDLSDNVFFSPSSVYNALLLAYFVSANETHDSLKKALRIPENQDTMDTLGAYSLEKYYQKLRSIRGSLDYQLSNANRMFVSDKFKVRTHMKEYFNDTVEPTDFKNTSVAISRINSWVSEQTRNNINNLLSSDSLNINTNLVLVNAAYFRGIWKNQFSPSETREAEFTLANGTSVPVMMMSLERKLSHMFDEELGIEVLELPYEGDTISMFILLPLNQSAISVENLLNKINASTLLGIVNKSSPALDDVTISIPKFSVDRSLELTPIFESMGAGDLFQSFADLTCLSETSELHLDTAIHKAKITVDEFGTVAAATTAIFSNRFAADSFIANHPFVYFIFDKKANILLFLGIFNTPET